MNPRQKRIMLMAEDFKGRLRTAEGYPVTLASAVGISYMEISGAAAGVGEKTPNLCNPEDITAKYFSSTGVLSSNSSWRCSGVIDIASGAKVYISIDGYSGTLRIMYLNSSGGFVSFASGNSPVQVQVPSNVAAVRVGWTSQADGKNVLITTDGTRDFVKYGYAIPLNFGSSTMTVYTPKQLAAADIAVINISRKTANVNGTDDITAMQDWDSVPSLSGDVTVTADTAAKPPLFIRYYSKVKGE